MLTRFITRVPRVSSLATAMAAGLALTVISPVAGLVGGSTALNLVGTAQAQDASQTADQFQAILARYGTFQTHARYGEVWIPARETAPEGWHPYPPCNWIHTKDLGWYFNDKTEWGKIVHHYGRWAHDKQLGWVWVKGQEFSPGWVVWRTSDTWVGWAPMPPEADMKDISAIDFNTDKHWIFTDAKKFSSGCAGGTTLVTAPPALYPVILSETRIITEIRFVHGIAIFVLPPPLIINIVDIDIGVFPPWSPCFFGAWFWNWNWMVNTIIVNVNLPAPQCVQPSLQPRPIIPIKSLPPPPPGQSSKPDKRAELPPALQPPTRSIDPPKVRDPGLTMPLRPIDPGFTRPHRPIDPGFHKPDRLGQPGRPESVKPKEPNRPQIVDVPKRPEANPRPPKFQPNIGKVQVVERKPVPKLVRGPELVKRPSGVVASGKAGQGSGGSNLR